MTRLIDSGALKHSLNITGDETSCIGCSHLSTRGCYESISYVDVCTAIDEQPTIDAEHVRHGKWIWKGEDGDSRWMCSECKCKEYVPTCNGVPDIWHYCPNCGCRVDKDD